ncbi:hypothetical protein PV375_01060 [Gulosibacter sp. GYB002]|uniref:hypothetical protein n=1 Tax=Gulosibacter sp. GYB002 TaxID=2994391 RepID=UPI002F966865
MSDIDPMTGEVVQRPLEVVAVDIAALDEQELAQLFPTPVQAAGALLKARQAVARAPYALRKAKEKLRAAERDLKLAIARATLELAEQFQGMSVSERSKLAEADTRVIDARETADMAWIELEYAKDWDRALGRDVELLRSVNANMRAETK